MKKYMLIFLLLTGSRAFTQATVEKEIETSVNRVVLYNNSAQVHSESTVMLAQGQTVLKFTKLSPYIRKESIKIEGDGSFKIINVQHQNDFLNELERSQEIETLKSNIQEFQNKIEDEETLIKIIGDKLDFLKSNKEITGKEQTLSPDAFNSMIAIYGRNIETLSLDLLKKQRLINDYKKETARINSQLYSLTSKDNLPSGTIIVTLDAKQARSSKIGLSYLVDNVSWVPSYDIRFEGVNKPLSVTFKANIRQNTGVDWKNVNIVLSTANTNISAKIPDLNPLYLQFYYPEITSALQGRAAGVQITGSGNPGAESQVVIRGYGSVKDKSPLYVVDGVPVNDIGNLNPENIRDISVLKDESASAIYGSRATNGVVEVTTGKRGTSVVPLTITSKNESSNEYFVEAKQTVLSNNKTTTINFKELDLKADFEYQAVPKLSANVFLIARIPDWYKADFMSGDANLYMENSFIGNSEIIKQQFSDTMEISFGIDNNIEIKRERLPEFSEKQFMGPNKKETLAYKLVIRNNKNYPVSTKISDQIPVSTMKEIQVEPLELSGGKMDKDNGSVEWLVELAPNETREIIIRYSVKYPRDRAITM
jgi:TonB-dependent SusC/RagA subfamily outer membrane receptor